jgi:hypothetical protein
VGADATSVLIEGLALPEDERARAAAELFASLESRDPEYSADDALVWGSRTQRSHALRR